MWFKVTKTYKMPPTHGHELQDFIRQESPHKFLLTCEKRLPQDADAYTKLMMNKAVVTGDVDLLKELIGRCHNPRQLVNSQDLSGCTALHVAARFNQVMVAEVLLSHGADCNRLAWSTVSPLEVACHFEHEKMIRLLLKCGSDPLQKLSGDGNVLHSIALHSTVKAAELVFGRSTKPPVNSVDGLAMTPLHKAAQAGNNGMCLWLLRNGADPLATDVRQMSPFMIACRLGHSDIMATLLFSYTIDAPTKRRMISDADNEGMTALHHAILSGRYQTVQALLLWGADPNIVNVHCMSPLHLGVAEGNVRLVSVLAAHTTDLSIQDSQGRTPLHRAVELKHKDIIHNLLKQGASPDIQDACQITPFLLACSTGYAEVLGLFWEYKADIGATNFYGQTCLHVAVEGGHLGVLRQLLERCKGSSSLLQKQDLFGQSVLHEAAKQADHQFVQELLCQGCSAEIKDVTGMLPLHVASCCGGYQTVLKLAEVAPDVNVKSPEGKTAFYLACEFGNGEAVAALIKVGADVKIIDSDFKNSLMAAAIGGFTDIVIDLIDKGVQIDCKDTESNTALHHACLHGRLATVKALLDHGACVSSINIHGQTPLAMAVEKSKSEVAAMLMEHGSWEASLSAPSHKGFNIVNKMIENTPTAVQIVLDKCVKTSDHATTDEDYAIEFNYKYINSQSSYKSASECVFVTMLNCGREDLLSHQLCQSNFSYKWHTFGKASFLIYAMIQLGYLLSLATFYYLMPRPHDSNYRCSVISSPQANDTNGTEFSGNQSHSNATDPKQFWKLPARPRLRYGYMVITEYILYVFMFLQIVKDFYTCFAVGLKYVKTFHFITQSIIDLMVAFSVVPPGYELCDFQWRLISYALFIFFLKTSVTCQSLNGIGLFFTMFIEVAKTMLKISILMMFFIPAVSIPLSVMVNQQGFLTHGVALYSVFAMTLGELNFRDTFVLTDNSPFTTDLYLLFPILCILLNCTFMNLMIGVAVGDITKVEKTAYLSGLRAHILYLIETEQMLLPTGRRKLLKDKLVVRPNSKSRSFNDRMRRTFLYCEQISFIKKTTGPSSLTEPELALVKELDSQKASLEKLTKATDDILNILQKIAQRSYQMKAEDSTTAQNLETIHADTTAQNLGTIHADTTAQSLGTIHADRVDKEPKLNKRSF